MHKLNLTVPCMSRSLAVSPTTVSRAAGTHTAAALIGFEPNVIQQMARDHALHHLKHRHDELKPRGQLLVVAARAAAQPQEAVRQDAAFAEGVELTRRWPEPVWAGGV
jgi:hypothetical protein